jgi:hypothetical protein
MVADPLLASKPNAAADGCARTYRQWPQSPEVTGPIVPTQLDQLIEEVADLQHRIKPGSGFEGE